MRLEESSYEMTAMAFDSNQGEFKGDENLRVQFSYGPVFDQAKSDKEGRPIFNDEVFVMIMVPGQTDIVHRRAWEKDYKRFPKQYQAFLNNQDQDAASGTPLKLVTWLSGSQVKELEYFNVRTVEQLANMPDNTVGKFMALAQLKQRAKDFLEAANKAAPLIAMRAELEARDSKIEVMERQLAAMSRKIEELTTEDA